MSTRRAWTVLSLTLLLPAALVLPAALDSPQSRLFAAPLALGLVLPALWLASVEWRVLRRLGGAGGLCSDREAASLLSRSAAAEAAVLLWLAVLPSWPRLPWLDAAAAAVTALAAAPLAVKALAWLARRRRVSKDSSNNGGHDFDEAIWERAKARAARIPAVVSERRATQAQPQIAHPKSCQLLFDEA